LLTDHNVREVLKITDRSYLIKDGKVVTKGTPEELIHDPIAIDGYLGKTFVEDALGRPMDTIPMAGPSTLKTPVAQPVATPSAASNASAVNQLLAQEKIHRLVEQLKITSQLRETTKELLAHGQDAVPALLEALERKDIDLRSRSFEVLKHILGGNLQFDPFAPEEHRRRLLAALRERFLRAA
jgi:lipopolysaccharide export system ATP-binding protein